MTVQVSTNGTIRLIGQCPSDDAEALQRHLLNQPGASVDWSGCEQLHAAVLQILLAANPVLNDMPAGAFLKAHVAPLLNVSAGNSGAAMTKKSGIESMTYKVLIVDDSKLARMAVVKILNSHYPGWPRCEAGSAEEAMKSTMNDAPDIALLDYNMPIQNGLDLAAHLRKLKPGMPIAVISANHQLELVRRAQALGAFFLPKPLSEEALKDFLASAVQSLQAAAS